MKKALERLRQEARHRRNCPLWANATQTVSGAGDPHARVRLVGEQPSLLGRDFRVSLTRGRFVEIPHAPYAFATYHPSVLLRLRDGKEKEAALDQLVKDLALIRKALRSATAAPPRHRAGASAPR